MSRADALAGCPSCGAQMADGARFCGSCGAAISMAGSIATGGTGGRSNPVGAEVAGRYRILAKLGEGGMGAVYRAEQISLKRTVALKILRPELSTDPALVRRFNVEAELAAKLSHPNTVTLFDFGQDHDGSLFIAMEFIEGKSLRDVLARQGAIEPYRILHICKQVCASLADAHSHGIVHRDLKPDNIMLSERGSERDIARVLDFGIAKMRDEQGNVSLMPMTRAGDLLGTPQYMAPEQIRGEKVDARTDIYALGVMLFEMLTGKLPFDGGTVMALLSKHLTEEPRPPEALRPDLPIPAPLSRLCLAMLAKDPARRPANMETVRHELDACARTGVPTPVPTTMPSLHAGLPGSSHYPSEPSMPPPGSLAGAPSRSAAPTPAASPTMHPVSTPTAPSSDRGSRTGLWVVLGVIVLAIAGGATYWILQRNVEQRDNSDGFDMKEWEGKLDPEIGDDDGEEPDNLRGATVALANATARLDDLDADEEALPALAQDRPGSPGSDVHYRDAAHHFSLRLPAGFIGNGDGQGSATFVGMDHGRRVTILVSSWHDPSIRDDAGMIAALSMRTTSLDFVIDGASWTMVQGKPVLLGQAHTSDGTEQGSFLFARAGEVLYFAAVGGPIADMSTTAAFQRQVLQQRLSLP